VRIARLYADERGETHFGHADIPLASAALFPEQPPYRLTRFSAPRGVKLFAVPAGSGVFEWHTAPERQLAVALNGTVEYETSDGEIRRLGPGEVLLVEDTTGRGHVTRFPDEEQYFFHIPVPDDWPVS